MKSELAQRAKKLFTGNLALWWATGAGKSGAALECCTVFENPKVLILVEKIAHIENWKKEIVERKSSITPIFSHYNSLHKLDKDWDVIICDEADVLVTDKRLGELQSFTGRLLFLSAKVPQFKLKLLKHTFKFKEDSISLAWAIKNKLLPKPKFILKPIYLSNQRDTHTFLRGSDKKKKTKTVDFQGRFEKGFNLRISCSERQYYDLLIEEYNLWKSIAEKDNYKGFSMVKFLRKGLEIKQFLDSLKIPIIDQLFNINGRRLIFVSSIEQAERYGNAIHSKKPLKENEQLINDFNEHKINYVVNVGILVRGMNLVDVENSVIGTYSKEGIQLEQMIGRSLRYCTPTIYIPFVKDTTDEKKLFEILQKF